MKSFATCLIFAFAVLIATASAASAQGPASGPVEEARDKTKEMAAKHNLDVARYYLTKRKAYDGARDRLQEIIETYPDFSRMDEVVFLMGEAHEKLGKPETAIDYYNKLLKTYPDSELVKKTRERLDKLKVEKKAGEEKL
ncbi:MAG TPA: outer membrane protein assembly factor BamD [Blastocatellia bacterium]|nr:outer membrane protein assembly factor BamD [Blastocatellia bacterium]